MDEVSSAEFRELNATIVNVVGAESIVGKNKILKMTRKEVGWSSTMVADDS